MGKKAEAIDFIRPAFPYEGVCQTFRERAADYGFIERYERDKEEITGISAEQWHFRYVGRPHGWIIKEKGLALEEYITYLLINLYCTCPGQLPLSFSLSLLFRFLSAFQDSGSFFLYGIGILCPSGQ